MRTCVRCSRQIKKAWRKTQVYCSMLCARKHPAELIRAYQPIPAPVPASRWILTNREPVLVDAELYEELNKYLWSVESAKWSRYAQRHETLQGKRRKRIFMHHQIMGDKNPVDHINGNTLDNRRSNLRFASQADNAKNKRVENSTGYKGVCRYGNKFAARIMVNGKRRIVDICETASEAALAYDKAAKEYYGEFAKPNFEKDS